MTPSMPSNVVVAATAARSAPPVPHARFDVITGRVLAVQHPRVRPAVRWSAIVR